MLLDGVDVRDLTLAELRRFYDAILYTVGAPSDRALGIPGGLGIQ